MGKRKYVPKKKKSSMTNRQRLYKMIKDNRSVLLKDLLEKFENKKELFDDLQRMTDARIIGFSEIAGEGLKYYVKKNLY